MALCIQLGRGFKAGEFGLFNLLLLVDDFFTGLLELLLELIHQLLLHGSHHGALLLRRLHFMLHV